MCSWLRMPREWKNVRLRVDKYLDFTLEEGRWQEQSVGQDDLGTTGVHSLITAWSSLIRALQLESVPAAQTNLPYYQFLAITLFYVH